MFFLLMSTKDSLGKSGRYLAHPGYILTALFFAIAVCDEAAVLWRDFGNGAVSVSHNDKASWLRGVMPIFVDPHILTQVGFADKGDFRPVKV